MYKVKCCKCGAVGWVRGSYDPETNATEIKDEDLSDLEDGDGGCSHEEYEIIEQRDPDDYPDFPG